MRRIDKHIIHCSDSVFGNVETIRRWHKERGWRDIGYHFVIRRDGIVELGRSLDEMGAHCKGKNANSIGTCLVGVDHFTSAQMRALRMLHQVLSKIFIGLKAHGHRDFNSAKACPNFEVKEVLK